MSAAPTRFEPSPLVYAAPSPGKGMGVFARAPIAAGTVVERAPVLVCPDSEWEALNRTAVGSYYLAWGDSASAVMFGFGSLYNHSDTPNTTLVRHVAERYVEFVALRDIAADEELLWKYNCTWW